MHVGLDLGTALTKIARYPADSGQPDSGEPGTAALAIKPSAVSYHQLGSEIPAFSSAGEQPPLTVRCDGFPLMLESRPQGCVNIWGGRTAAEVTQAYLRCLLAADELGDGELVVAVPAHAATLVSTGGLFGSPRPASARPLPQVQAAVPDILTALGRPPSRVVAAPVAAVAYLRHTRPELKDVTRFIVCDIGAGAISFALCEVGSRATRLADCVRLTDSAVWNADSGGFTEAMDVSCPVVERLIIELARKVGTPPRDWSARRWRGLEWLLRQHGDWPSIVRNADGPLGPPQGDTEQPIADLRVTTDQLLAVCSPLARRGAEALRSIIRGQQKDDWRVTGRRTGPKIVFLGGLGGLGPVRAALLKAAGADPAYPGDAEVRLDAETRLGAVAQGAALVAAGEPAVPARAAAAGALHRGRAARVGGAGTRPGRNNRIRAARTDAGRCAGRPADRPGASGHGAVPAPGCPARLRSAGARTVQVGGGAAGGSLPGSAWRRGQRRHDRAAPGWRRQRRGAHGAQ